MNIVGDYYESEVLPTYGMDDTEDRETVDNDDDCYECYDCGRFSRHRGFCCDKTMVVLRDE